MSDGRPDNPYRSPDETSLEESSQRDKDAHRRFALAAARFSAYTPFVILPLAAVLVAVFWDRLEHFLAAWASPVVGVLFFVITLAALAMGIVGFFAGRRSCPIGTVLMAMIGIVLNGGILTLWGFLLLRS